MCAGLHIFVQIGLFSHIINYFHTSMDVYTNIRFLTTTDTKTTAASAMKLRQHADYALGFASTWVWVSFACYAVSLGGGCYAFWRPILLWFQAPLLVLVFDGIARSVCNYVTHYIRVTGDIVAQRKALAEHQKVETPKRDKLFKAVNTDPSQMPEKEEEVQDAIEKTKDAATLAKISVTQTKDELNQRQEAEIQAQVLKLEEREEELRLLSTRHVGILFKFSTVPAYAVMLMVGAFVGYINFCSVIAPEETFQVPSLAREAGALAILYSPKGAVDMVGRGIHVTNPL